MVTGNVNTGYACSFETPVSGANITRDGTITAPSTVTAEIAYKEKCVAAADPNVAAYASGYFVPSFVGWTLTTASGRREPQLHRHAWQNLVGADQPAEECRAGTGVRESPGMRLLPAVRQPDHGSFTGMDAVIRTAQTSTACRFRRVTTQRCVMPLAAAPRP